jgi:hypothetical protein
VYDKGDSVQVCTGKNIDCDRTDLSHLKINLHLINSRRPLNINVNVNILVLQKKLLIVLR